MSKFHPKLVRMAKTLALTYAAVCGLVFAAQGWLVFPRGGVPSQTPEAFGLAFDDVTLQTPDGVRLHAWLVEPESIEPDAGAGPRGVVLLCHGNGGNIGHRLHVARALAERGWATLLLEYRGYGHSEGRPSEEGLYIDAVTAYDWLAANGFAQRIVGWGESLGAAVAIELALRRELRALVLHSPFLSLGKAAAQHYGWLPVRALLRYRFSSDEKIARVRADLLLLHGTPDRIVPFEQGQQLFELAKAPKTFVDTQVGHNDGRFLAKPAVSAALDELLR